MTNRNIYLYIDGQLADITSDTLVLFNYAASDLSNPAAVKNSYSQQAKLPGTATNDKIFSAIYRNDWRPIMGNGSVAGFNPLVRTPFAIYDELGQKLEAGYLVLRRMTDKKGVRTYEVEMYGGLGSFFYTLAYNQEGTALSLGDLPLLGDDPTRRIDFRINAEAVAAAWKRLRNPNAENTEPQYDVVNFAPAYNGLPAGEFDASKGVGDPRSVGGDAWETDDKGDTFTTYGPNNDALYDFGDDFTEWQMHDLRSYMQRPVVSVKALFEGIVRYATTKGFEVELDPMWFQNDNPYYRHAWMTLPLLAGRAVPTVEEQTINISGFDLSGSGEADTYGALAIPLNPSISVPNVDVTVKCTPAVVFDNSSMVESSVWLTCQPIQGTNLQNLIIGSIFFAQVQLLDAKGNILASSPIQVGAGGKLYHGDRYEPSAQQLVEAAKLDRNVFRNQKNINDTIHTGPAALRSFDTSAGMVRHYVFSAFEEVEVTAYNAASARIVVEPRQFYWTMDPAPTPNVAKRQLYVSNAPQAPGTLYNITRWGGMTTGPATLEYAAPSTEYRSGVPVTQEALFADTMSPMEFLLSYTKTFGLHYIYDRDRQRVRIVTRNTLYGERRIVDFQERIDRSREMKIETLPMSTKWLSFKPGTIEGEFAEYYKRHYGREYGAQTVNTGYDFNAETTEVMDGVKFAGGPEVLERSKYFLYVKNKDRSNVPAPVIDAKTTYKLFRRDNDGELQGYEQPFPNLTLRAAGFQGFQYFSANKGYDGVAKLQCHGDDNDGTDGAGILLFHRGLASEDPATVGDAVARRAYDGFRISDDSPAMYDLAGKPCWELVKGTPASDLPAFGRFYLDGVTVKYSMEFSTPQEIDNPVIAVGADSNVYDRAWGAYIGDRNNIATRVCTAYVDMRGLQPGPEMLRHFYHFDGALWVLNRIINYVITRPGTTQCEFIRVQDAEHYAGGQSIAGWVRGWHIVKPWYRTGETCNAAGTVGAYDCDGYYSVTYYREAQEEAFSYPDGTGTTDTRTTYRAGDVASKTHTDGQCEWARAWRVTRDWYRTGSTCNAAGVNGAHDCDGTYSVTYWNEAQDQAFAYPDGSGVTEERTIWRVGPEATREQVDGQCGYVALKELSVRSTSWMLQGGHWTDESDNERRGTDGTLYISTMRTASQNNGSGATYNLNGITLNGERVAPAEIDVTIADDSNPGEMTATPTKSAFGVMVNIFKKSDGIRYRYAGTLTIRHIATGAKIIANINLTL